MIHGGSMDDTMRTHVMNYLEDFCNVECGKTEKLAEGLNDYLNERGYGITDLFLIEKSCDSCQNRGRAMGQCISCDSDLSSWEPKQ